MALSESIGQILGGALSGGGLGSVASASSELLKLINYLTADNPVKNADAIREFRVELTKLIREVTKIEDGSDVSSIVDKLTTLLNS